MSTCAVSEAVIRNTILVGDVLDRLRELPSESVHCVVTSPPYWGLRDYGTGKWEGGEAGCDHKQTVARRDGGRTNIDGFHGAASSDSDKGAINYRDICGKCGARRIDRQIGLEATPELFIARMVEVFREVRRVLRKDGTCWVNLGDSYAANGSSGLSLHGASSTIQGSANAAHTSQTKICPPGLKTKDLCGIPWRVAFALQADGWYLRSDIIWHKPNPMPESVTDRPTKAHEYLFLLTKSARYWYDADAVREDGSRYEWNTQKFKGGDIAIHHRSTEGNESAGPTAGRNRRDVWTIATEAFPGAHFATFPRKLVEPCILAGCPAGGVVLDPFFGSGTVGVVALSLGRQYIGIELNPAYAEMARNRIEHGTVDPDQVEEEKAQGTLFDIHQADVI